MRSGRSGLEWLFLDCYLDSMESDIREIRAMLFTLIQGGQSYTQPVIPSEK